MTNLFLIGALSFVLFLMIFISVLRAIPVTISELRYMTNNDKFGKILFYVWAIVVSIPLMISWLDSTYGQTYQFLVFFSCVSFIFVGAASSFKDGGITEKVHYVAAAMAGVSSFIWAIIYSPVWWIYVLLIPLFGVIGANVHGIRKKNGMYVATTNTRVFFLELGLFLSAFSVIGSHIFNL